MLILIISFLFFILRIIIQMVFSSSYKSKFKGVEFSTNQGKRSQNSKNVSRYIYILLLFKNKFLTSVMDCELIFSTFELNYYQSDFLKKSLIKS